MPVFAYCIAADQDRPSETGVFVRAETIRQAVALVGHPEVNGKRPKGVQRLTKPAYP
jgi:hypothetical protein